jgi:imidazolonepropionase-like amidohydrolase
VKVAFGSDTIYQHDWATREFAELVRLGLAPLDALRAATVNASQALGISAEVGTLEAGKVADIIAVSANPLEDIRTLETVRFVMKSGHVARDFIH